MTEFSANLGFLWSDRSLPEAIRAANSAGFDAVECHWPYEYPAADVKAALQETGLKMLGLNTRPGDQSAGEFGLSALPGREGEARAAIDEAIAYATAIDAQCIHVMAGVANGEKAHRTFASNLRYACEGAAEYGITILIEPLNTYDAPGYFLTATDHAQAIIDEVGPANLKLMFDCYHVQRMEGDLPRKLADLLPIIGHIQFASVPDRGPPDRGEIDYAQTFKVVEDLGWRAPLGAEYKPGGDTDATLDWMSALR